MMAVAIDPESGHINYEYYINQIMVWQKYIFIFKYINNRIISQSTVIKTLSSIKYITFL
jgi:hypothetical protein